ncbi:efflux RND transporter periplasmic adaptor subunit [Thiolapillus sp.]
MNRLRRLLVPLLIIALAIAVFLALKATKPHSKDVEIQEKAWPVAAVPVKTGEWPTNIMLYGAVDALRYSVLTAALTADVKQVHVIEGSQVGAGDLLVELDDQDAKLDLIQRQADVAQAQAAIAVQESRHQADLETLPSERRLYKLVQAEVARLLDLKKKQVGSQSALDTARQNAARQSISIARIEESIRTHESKMLELQAALERARAALEKARLQLERTRVKAPFDGRVVKVLVAQGHRANAGAPLLEMFENASLMFRAMLPAIYVPQVRKALAEEKPLVVAGAVDGNEVRGHLISLGAEVRQGSGGVEALFQIDSGWDWLQKGRVMQLRLTLPKQSGVMPVPFEALYGSDKVYVIDAQQRLRPVRVERVGEIWLNGKNQVLIRSPQLKSGQQLLVTQLPNAVESLLVEVVAGG